MPETTSKSTKKYIIGNWKSNKNIQQVEAWFSQFAQLYSQNKSQIAEIEAVICPVFIHLELSKNLIKQYQLPLKIGAQSLSPFRQGAYTGEVAATQLTDYVEYVIIGHSERRNNFYENDQMLEKKVNLARSANLQVIFCVPDITSFIPDGVNLVAFEPLSAIGSGKAENPKEAIKIAQQIKTKKPGSLVIYGGSVTPSNIGEYLQSQDLHGVLPGKSSLDPAQFFQMLTHAAS